MTTAFPIAEAIPKLQPGVYVLAAHAVDQEGGRRLAQRGHAVVHRLRPRPHRHQRRRRHACLRALAGRRPRRSVNANVRLLARNNEVLGTAKTDSRGYARFDAGLKRGEGGLAPAVLVAETPDGDYAFLDLSIGRLRPDRPRRQGPHRAGPARRLRLHRPRRLSRRRGGAPDRAGARPRRQAAAPFPSRVIFSRPDGVEHSRVALTDQGLGGRATKLALAARP